MIASFMNMKGGVGKTTLCVHLAGAASNKGYRILIIDFDPQFNLTQHLLKPKEYFKLEKRENTIYRILQPEYQTPNPFKVDISSDDYGAPKLSTVIEHLFDVAYTDPKGCVDLVPGSNKLMYLVLGKHEKSTKPMEKRFHSFIQTAEKKYDHIFIDCHPAGSFLTKSALTISHMVITPVVPDAYSQRGLVLMSDFIEYLSKFAVRKPKLKVIFNKVPWSNPNQNLISTIRRNEMYGSACIDPVLHVSESITLSGKEIGPSWRRIMQWSKKPWKERVKIELAKIFEDVFEGGS